jgi:hypothetical protein
MTSLLSRIRLPHALPIFIAITLLNYTTHIHAHKTEDRYATIRFSGISLHYTLHCIIIRYPHSAQTAIMLRCCIVCRAGESPDLQLQYCGVCQSALYCSKACQRKDWKQQHRQICKLLNVGHGDMQVQNGTHTDHAISLNALFERRGEGILDEDGKRFFKLFQESTQDESRAAARKMKKIARRQIKNNRECLLHHSLHFLIRYPSELLSWSNSPLLVMLQFVDPNVMSREGQAMETPLHFLAELADPSDYSAHENQLIIAKQLIEYGANVNAVSIPSVKTPLHNACHWSNVTNLDFVEFLLEAGANPNAQDNVGLPPLMHSIKFAPGAAKFLLNWPSTDVNITTRSGASFLAKVRVAVKHFVDQIAVPNNPEKVQHQFLLQQWRDIEKMLVERSAH